jgi:heme O synthase-like polyprenyltransferase
MKYFYYVLTIALYSSTLFFFKILDDFTTIICLLVAAVSLAIILSVFANQKNDTVKAIKWGFLYGSLTIITLFAIFMIFLASNYPR